MMNQKRNQTRLNFLRSKNSRLALIFGALALASAGCGGPSIKDMVQEASALSNKAVTLVCSDCFDELGFDSQGACEDYIGLIGPNRERCYVEAYERDQDASDLYLECITKLQQGVVECIEGRLNCDDGDSLSTCYEDFSVGVDRCIEPPNTVLNALDDCGD